MCERDRERKRQQRKKWEKEWLNRQSNPKWEADSAETVPPQTFSFWKNGKREWVHLPHAVLVCKQKHKICDVVAAAVGGATHFYK